MAYGRDRFVDPKTGEEYAWPINHAEEDSFGRGRQMDYGAPTANTGLTRTQGADEPMLLQLRGTILHAAQHAAFIHWWEISRQRTIEFHDFAGDIYEVTITEFKPSRQRTLRNPRDPSIPLHYWTYSLTMDVLGVRAGPWAEATP